MKSAPGREKHGTGGDDSWSSQGAVLDLAPPGFKSIEVAAHVADSGDPVCDEQWNQGVFRPCRVCADASDVSVHVPQSGNQKLAAAVNQLGVCGNPYGAAPANRGNRIAGDDDGLIPKLRTACDVDYGDVCDGQGLLRHRGEQKPRDHVSHRKNCDKSDSSAQHLSLATPRNAISHLRDRFAAV